MGELPSEVDAVRVYALDPRAVDAELLARLAGLLDAEETARAARFHFDEHRRRFVAAHGFLREALARETGRDPRALRFETGPHGKPRLLESALHFSLTHTAEHALVAVGAAELGLDAEELRPERVDDPLARRVMTAEEFASWSAVPRAEQVRGFFRLWSAKESVMKAAGLGLALPPHTFAVLGSRSLELRARATAAGREWSLRELEGAPEFSLALATQVSARVARIAWP